MKEKYLIPASIVISGLIIAIAWIYNAGVRTSSIQPLQKLTASLDDLVLPPEGIVLPIKWDELGKKMVEAGVIDENKFPYEEVGEFRIDRQNASYLLNLLWAFGLANKNEILEKGPMTDPRYGGPAYFASTGGWTLAKGDAMSHYSRHQFVTLTPEQQQLVEKVSRGIYRPCCDNPTHFPDCNHGMAMLGLLELLAAEGVNEEEMYRLALQINSYWFPETYLAIAEYLQSKGVEWSEADPKEILGPNFSSISGYGRILSEFTPSPRQGGASCGV